MKVAWLRGGFRIINGKKTLLWFADTDCTACRDEVEYLKEHPDAKAIVIGRSHIALTGYYRSFWRLFWEVENHLCPKCGSEMKRLTPFHYPEIWDCPACGHEEKVKK